MTRNYDFAEKISLDDIRKAFGNDVDKSTLSIVYALLNDYSSETMLITIRRFERTYAKYGAPASPEAAADVLLNYRSIPANTAEIEAIWTGKKPHKQPQKYVDEHETQS